MDGFIYLKFGFIEFGVIDEAERLRRYRRHVYEAGAVAHPEKNNAGVIQGEILEAEREAAFRGSVTPKITSL